MRVETFALGPLETNSYLAIEGRNAVAVDAGGDPAPMLRHIAKHGLTLTHVLLTHLHFDHTYGAQALHEATGAPVLAGSGDAYLMDSELGQGGFMGLPRIKPFTYTAIEPGDFEVLGQPCTALFTPGHTAGSLSYYFPQSGVVFAGDVLFFRNIGRTDFPGGSMETLLDSVKTQIFSLPRETVVYSGHGPETSVGEEILHNPYFSDFAR
ncbi:MBL fold metallo-hydrolase [Fundidesulfovibrio terrae]|uniref:MBL fold metallo-hydrolase n=1 Tax=Fundidesulfovibrio terrae TaxID=2922866 RepID=UPI001FB014CA|nr:MBL fold metallo-hydrolase [Fundidesulfovibrio terrae]